MSRALALSAAGEIPREGGKQVVAPLSDDPDPLVKKYAQVVAEELKRPPATKPSTAPSSQPAAGATTEP